MPERRKYDEGSIVQVGENKYRLFVSDGKGQDRKRKRPSRTVEAEDDGQALQLLKRFKKEVERDGLPAPRNMTFTQLWDIYTADHLTLNCAPKTREWYRNMGKRLNAYFGAMRVTQIREADITNFYKLLMDPNKTLEYRARPEKPGAPGKIKQLKGGLVKESIAHHRRALRAVLNYAADPLKVIKENPAAKVKVPKNAAVPEKPQNFFEDTELDGVISALVFEPLKWQAICIMDLTTGMRREDVAGAKWSDFSEGMKKLRINRAVQYVPREGLYIGPTKTEQSKRTLHMAEIAIYLLAAWKEEQRQVLQRRIRKLKEVKVVNKVIFAEIEKLNRRLNNFEDEFVFNQPDGSPINPDSMTKHWSAFIKKNELSAVTFNGLRHTHATISLADGGEQIIKALASRLGHADAKMTLNTYAGALESADKKIAKKWDKKIKWHGNGTISEFPKNPVK